MFKKLFKVILITLKVFARTLLRGIRPVVWSVVSCIKSQYQVVDYDDDPSNLNDFVFSGLAKLRSGNWL